MPEFDLTNPQWWIPLAAGIVVPLLVAWLTKLQASPQAKGVIATVVLAVIAGVTQLGVYLNDQDLTLEGAIVAFLTAAGTAVAIRNGTPVGGWDTKLAIAQERKRRLAGKPDFGLGKADPAYSPKQLDL